MIIPSEGRATILALREGRSLEEFLDDMWRRRQHENPRETKSKGRWPARLNGEEPTNVMKFKRPK